MIWDRDTGPLPAGVPTLGRTIPSSHSESAARRMGTSWAGFSLLTHKSQPVPCAAEPKLGWTLDKGCRRA